MRIALLANSYPPRAQGGAGQIAFLQAEWLKTHGHELRVFVPAPFPIETSDASITVFKPKTKIAFADLPNHNFLARLIFHFEDLAPNTELIESISAYKPDVIITQNLTGCGWGTPKVLSQTGIRWIHILHDVQMFEPSGQIQHGETLLLLRHIWRAFWAKQRRKALGSPHTVISPSYWLLKYHQSFNLFPNSKTTVIPNPAVVWNNELQTTAQLAHSPREKDHNSTTSVKTVLYVGRVSKDKGLDVLIQAWQLFQKNIRAFRFQSLDFKAQIADFQVPSSMFQVRLVIIGYGSYQKTIEDLKDPTIECLGAVDHDKLVDYYSSASLMVFPSLLMENQPTVLLEAMSAGVNIVASNIGGVRELLQGYGTLVPPGDPDKLAEAIKDQLQKKLNAELAHTVLLRHNIDQVMEQLTLAFSE